MAETAKILSPNKIAKIITGVVGSMGCGVKLSNSAPFPSWNIQTNTQKEAATDSTFITRAFRGKITDLTWRKIRT